ncbi:MAG: protein kinase [Phycisphaerales bacterium]|nr:protein kinase [Phycisphaerales bacterium]
MTSPEHTFPDHRRQQAKDILLDAIEHQETDRAAFLDRACAGDAALRRQVDEMLRAHRDASAFMGHPTVGAPVALPGGEAECGERIGPYRLLRMLGEGGFGTVFLAEQEHPVRRLVALKILKAGMDSAQIVARFEAERQALALMEHPGIARIHDAGATAQGRPYFVMEYVDGDPITAYCDDRRLTVRERLEVFHAVCLAVQHAHQKGVVHRDLKPTNVLVADLDGRPAPKVIDFGIAKAIAVELSEHSVQTLAAQLLGTPEYMAPEQAAIGGQDVDTRADVYSLGVLLYELLVGTAPFDRSRLKGLGLSELEHFIRHEVPPRPSSRVASMDREADAVAAARRVDPARLRRQLRDDLDWIVMRAVEKDRSRRYPAVTALADDVQRHLEHKPVDAGPPGTLYRIGKFWQRHRVVATATALVALALVVTVVVSLRSAAIADEARIDALAAEQESSRNAYSASLLAASSALRLHDAAGARWHLGLAPAIARGWEWFYLRGVTDRSQWTHGLPSDKPQALAASRDGRHVAFSTIDRKIVVLDAAEGSVVARFEGHDDSVLQLRFSADGDRLFSGDAGGVVCRWDIVSGAPLGRFQAHGDRVDAMRLARDGSILATAGWDGFVRLWDSATLALVHEFGPVGSPINLLAVDADLNRVAAGSWDQHLRVWNATTGELLVDRSCARATTPLAPPSRFPAARLSALEIDSAGRFIAAGTADGLVRLLDAADGSERATLDVGLRYVRDLAIDRRGEILAAGLIDGAIATWRLPTAGPLAEMMGHIDDVRAIQFTPDGRLVSASFDNTLRIWDPESGRSLATLEGHEGGIFQLALSESGAFAVTGAADGTVRRWAVDAGASDVLVVHPSRVTALAISPDSKTVVSSSFGGALAVHQIASATQFLRSTRQNDPISAVALSPDGALAAVGHENGRVELMRLRAKVANVQLAQSPDHVQHLRFSPDGGLLAGAFGSGEVRLWRLAEGTDPVARLKHPDQAMRVDFTPDGRRAVTACADGVVRVWNLDDWQLEREIVSPSSDLLECLAVSPDGQRVAFGGYGRVVHIADLATGRTLQTCRAHGDAVNDVAWLPDGSRVVSASRDRTLRIWDPERGDAVCILYGHEDEVSSLAVAPDGSFILSGGQDNTVRIWRAGEAPAPLPPGS